jgi:hypothetical protein
MLTCTICTHTCIHLYMHTPVHAYTSTCNLRPAGAACTAHVHTRHCSPACSQRVPRLPQGACGRTTLTNTALVMAAYANGGCTNPDNAAPGTIIYGGAYEPAARCYDVHNTLTINTGGFQYTGSVQTLCAKSSCVSGVLQLSLQFDDGTGQTIPCPTGQLPAGAWALWLAPADHATPIPVACAMHGSGAAWFWCCMLACGVTRSYQAKPWMKPRSWTAAACMHMHTHAGGIPHVLIAASMPLRSYLDHGHGYHIVLCVLLAVHRQLVMQSPVPPAAQAPPSTWPRW